MRVPYRLALSIAYSDGVRASEVGRAYKVSLQVVSRVRACDALAYVMQQIDVGEDLINTIRRSCGGDEDRKIDYLIEHVMWDGTKQKLALKVDKDLTTSQSMSSWEVLVSKRVLVFGMGGRKLLVEWVVPPIPCVGSDAGTLHDALWLQAQSKRFVELVEFAAQFCKFVARARSMDAAKSNLKLGAFELHKCIPQDQAHASWLCSIHQNHLIIGSPINVLGLHLASGI